MRLAALDLGSNSFHLLVVDVRPDGSFETVVREKVVLRLGEVVAATGYIDDDAADRAVEAARQLNAIARAANAEVRAVGTAALRTATNGEDIADRLAAELDVPVRILEEEDEARLTFEAIRASVLIEPGPALALDLGGGSMEVMVGDRSGMHWARSVDLGASRLTGELIVSDPPTPEECRAVRRRVRQALAPLVGDVASRRPSMLIGSSGTIATLARAVLAGERPRSSDAVHQATVDAEQLAALAPRILEQDTGGRGLLSGVDQRRAPILPAGFLVVVTAMEVFEFETITVSEWALREGVVLDAIGHLDTDELTGDPRAIRAASVQALCARWGGPHGHSAQVAGLALELFDQLRGVHSLSADDREVLHHAALLHDIGEHVAIDGHERHSAYLVEHGRLRGFTPDEVAIVASVCRFHRRGSPKTSYPPFAALGERDRQRVTEMVALLRVADALDRSHSHVVRGFRLDVRADEVLLRLDAVGDITVELFGLRRKQELFERVFGRRLTVAVGDAGIAAAT